MRRCSGNMSDTVRTGPSEKIGDRFMRARKRERRSCKNGAEKYLETAVTANVVKRAPHDLSACGRQRLNCAGKTVQGVHDQLGQAGRTGCEEDPFRLKLRSPITAAGCDLSIARNEAFYPRVSQFHSSSV